MNFSWELVLYRLSGEDIGHVFQTCRNHREKSTRISLWTYLLKRDFPEHVKQFEPSSQKHEEWYKDFYENGAYFHTTKKANVQLEIPRCFFRANSGDIILSSYRFQRSVRLRHPDHHYVGIIVANICSKADRRKMRLGSHKVWRGIDFSSLMIVFSKESLDQDFSVVERIPFRSNWIKKHVEWLYEHFEVESIIFQPSGYSLNDKNSRREIDKYGLITRISDYVQCSFTFVFKMKPDCILKHDEEVLAVYQTCGEGGGLTKSGPCKNKVLSSLVHKQPEHPNYGRCGKHPREVGDKSMYKTVETKFLDSGGPYKLTYYPGEYIATDTGVIYDSINGEKIP